MNWLRRFMTGRYGNDSLNTAILVVYLILALISNLFGLHWLLSLAFLLLVWAFFRMLSRQHERRLRENQIFLAAWEKGKTALRPITRWWKGLSDRLRNAQLRRAAKVRQKADRKTHVYLSCPSCRQQLRLPKGKGKLKARCPKCGHEFPVKT